MCRGLLLLMALCCPLVSGCGGVRFVSKGPTRQPFTGAPTVLWKEYGRLTRSDDYEVLGTVFGRTGCFTAASVGDGDEELHRAMIAEATRHGADTVAINCGDINTIARCECIADALRRKGRP